jgi:hypothetical protein
MKLFQALSQVSATRFPKVEGERRPDYKAIFIDVVSMIFEARKVKFDRATVEKIAQHINLSSYQRAAASEAAKRYGKMNEKTGKREPVEAKPKAATKTGVKAIDGVKRRKDPITGEVKAKAAKVKAAKEKAAADKTPKKKPRTTETIKTTKEKTVAKAKKGGKKGKAEIDPITGEPV